eukprot:scaffold10073_cov136-Isochrysis_galbana.AAC.5
MNRSAMRLMAYGLWLYGLVIFILSAYPPFSASALALAVCSVECGVWQTQTLTHHTPHTTHTPLLHTDTDALTHVVQTT